MQTAACHAQSEGMNKVLKGMLHHTSNPKPHNWDEVLAPAEFAINNVYQASLQDMPSYLNSGRHSRLPGNLNLARKPSTDPAAADVMHCQGWGLFNRARRSMLSRSTVT